MAAPRWDRARCSPLHALRLVPAYSRCAQDPAGAWEPVGEPLAAPTATTASSTYDQSGAPWFLLHGASREQGAAAYAFRFDGREWQGQRLRLMVDGLFQQAGAAGRPSERTACSSHRSSSPPPASCRPGSRLGTQLIALTATLGRLRLGRRRRLPLGGFRQELAPLDLDPVGDRGDGRHLAAGEGLLGGLPLRRPPRLAPSDLVLTATASPGREKIVLTRLPQPERRPGSSDRAPGRGEDEERRAP